jgi:hypothetical protein
MRTCSNTPTRPGPLRRLRVITVLLPITACSVISAGSAWAATAAPGPAVQLRMDARPTDGPGLCTPLHLSGCDGSDNPIPGDGRTLKYCDAHGTCTPLPGPHGDEQA